MEFLDYSLWTTKDFLNMSLAIGFLILIIVLVMVLIRLYKILGKVDGITESVAEIIELVNHYLWQPARIAMQIIEKIKSFLGRKKK